MAGSGTLQQADAVQLGPFQRAALRTAMARRTVTASITQASGAAVYDAALAILDANPALRAELVDVPTMRMPWQRLAQVHGLPIPGDSRWEITSGATQVHVAERAGRCYLAVSAPPEFADLPSLAGFFHLVSLVLKGGQVPACPEPFAIEAGHLEMLRAGELSEEERYWRSCLEEPAGQGSHLTEVVMAPPRSGVDQARQPLGSRLAVAADALAAAAGGDFADIAHFALAVLLHRLDAQADRIERRVDARGLMGLAGAIGVFGHTVPSQPSVNPAQTVCQGLRAAIDRRRREDELVGCPSPRSGTDIPEILFSDDRHGFELPPEWQLEACTIPPDGHLVFGSAVSDQGRELVVRISDDRGTDPQLLVRLWSTVLGHMVDSPDSPVGDITLASAALVAELTGRLRAAAERPAADDICQALSRWAAEQPDGQAVRWPDGSWSFAELLHRVQAVAARLQGVGTGDVVAVAGRSDQPEMILGILAVLWRGAVFMPLDPDEPPARVADAVARSEAVAVLSTVPGLNWQAEIPVAPVCPSVQDKEVPVAAGPAEISGQSTAYVLRTSGSTGQPKLVAISRASLANYLRWVGESLVPSLLSERVLPALSPAVFDASFKQTLGMLYCGRPVWLPGSDRRDLASLLAELSACPDGIAVNCVPSYWSALLDAMAEGPAPRIGQVLLGGEPVTHGLLRRTREVFPAAQVWNLYGPTEATATATMGLLDGTGAIHVGRPIAGAVLAILDRYGALVPDGTAGELAIAGPGVALGYLADQGTAAPFITLTPESHTRAYRTGDYGWISDDGTLHLLGRRDTQVKVNGWRIELSEIESVAEQLDGVGRALVVIDDGATLRLFITGSADPAQVRTGLAGLLPAPMLPGSVHVVREFPVLATGKVDRASLLASVSRPAEEDPRVYDHEQLTVATVWRELLGSGWPRITEEFFEVGGHSLVLAQLVNRLRAQGFTQLSVRHVIRRPTVESIAALIRAGKAERT